MTLKTPIAFQLDTSRETVQYRVDIRVPEFGPFAQAPLIEGGSQMAAGDSLLTSILDGVAPSGASKLSVTGTDGRTSAYSLNDMVYVRTPLTLLSPGWSQSISSADGMNVYALEPTPVLLLSDNGTMARANLSEKEAFFDE